MTGVDRALIGDARRGLQARVDPARAPAMQAYMKSSMPYLGVPSAGVKAVSEEVFAQRPLRTFGAWRATALELWREATHREERYVAIALTGARSYRQYQAPAALPMYEEIVTTGACGTTSMRLR